MHRRSGATNLKRRLDPQPDHAALQQLAGLLRYGGNPEHKRNPGDFGLTPPAHPRADKSLCDDVRVFTRAGALVILRQGVERGLVSAHKVGGLPQNLWSVTDQGVVVEAQLENRDQCSYHAYPLPTSDPFVAVVHSAWRARG
jgi:hypothetical protein